ncbi:hypothetical protein [Streptomyces sp. NPDC042319]|uniref:hypothetical protein n=1 Tax=Streptomyces sp. NPDC042319 TaxID=3154332 RepID=UPI0033E72EB7
MSAKRTSAKETRPAPRSLEELVAVAELQGVTFIEVTGCRPDFEGVTPVKTSREEGDSEPHMKVWHRAGDGQIEVRCRLTIGTADSRFVADAVAQFAIAAALPEEEELQRAFTERVGIAVVYPYLRESVQQLAQKLDVDVPVLSLIAHKLTGLQLNTDTTEA